jgi:hypothetical protein
MKNTLPRDINYAIKLNFAVRSELAKLVKKAASNVIATSLKQVETPQSAPSPVAKSTKIFSPPANSPSLVAVTPIATSQRQLEMANDVATTVTTGPLANLEGHTDSAGNGISQIRDARSR